MSEEDENNYKNSEIFRIYNFEALHIKNAIQNWE